MNEKKKSLIVLVIFLVIVLLFIALLVGQNVQRKKIVKSFDDTFAASEEKLIYLGRPDCSACISFKPIFLKIVEDYKLSYLDINVDDITDKQLQTIVEKLGLNWEDFGTPSIAVVKENKVVKTNVGVISEDSLITFLKDSNMISEKEES